MKNLKNIVRISVIALVISMSFTSCEQREDWRFPELGNGGFIKFVQRPFNWEGSDNSGNGTITKYHIGADPATSSFSASVEDPNGNVASVDFFVKGDFAGAPEDAIAFASTNSFPFDVSFTTEEMANLFNIDASVIQTGDFFEFMTVLTTDDGRVWISSQTACDGCPLEPGDPNGSGTWNGGTIDGVILMGGDTGDNFLLPAVWYRVKYLAATN